WRGERIDDGEWQGHRSVTTTRTPAACAWVEGRIDRCRGIGHTSGHPMAPESRMANDRITLIDTGYIRPGLCAAWLVHGEGGRAALVDCGTATCAQRVLDAIEAAGVAREAVDWLLVTHVHLDHAGGAGPLMRAL